MSEEVKAKEPIVLDAEGVVLHDPDPRPHTHRRAQFKVVSFGSIGFLPKILLAVAFVGLLLLGLTVAGIALGVLFVSLLAKTLFKPRRR